MIDILGKESKFEKYAEKAANAYLNEEVPLNDSIVKIAEEKELNPEQIKRVVEAANVKVFQKHFGDDSREGHKDVDFDVADPQVVIRRIYIVKKAPESSSEDRPSSPLDFFKDLAMDNFSDRTQEDVEDLPVEEKKKDRPTLVLRIKTAKQNLEKKAYALSEDYTEKAKELAKQFRRIDAEKDAFEGLCKEAYTHRGTDLDEVLTSVANFAKKEFKTLEGSPMEKVAGFPSESLNKLYELEKIAHEYNRHVKAAELAQEQLDEMGK